MLIHHRPTKTIVSGKSGSGKTTYFQRLLENGFRAYWQTVFLFDWQGEMSQRLNMPAVDSWEQLPEALKTGFVIYDPSRDFENNMETGLCAFSKWAFEICKQAPEAAKYPRLFACDELQLLMGVNNIFPEVQAIVQTGRRMGLDMAIVSQQLNEMHNIFRSQTTERITFQHEDAYVLGVIDKWGFDPQLVKLLNTGEYLWRNDRGENGRGRLFGVDKQAAKPEVDNGRSSDAAPVA